MSSILWSLCLACCIDFNAPDSIYAAPVLMDSPPCSFLTPDPVHYQVAYKAGNEQSVHQYTISKDEPLFLRARANAAQLSEVLQGWALQAWLPHVSVISWSPKPPATLQ